MNVDPDALEQMLAEIDGDDVVVSKDQMAAIVATLRRGLTAVKALANIQTTAAIATGCVA